MQAYVTTIKFGSARLRIADGRLSDDVTTIVQIDGQSRPLSYLREPWQTDTTDTMFSEPLSVEYYDPCD